jgi:hypothetical protein
MAQPQARGVPVGGASGRHGRHALLPGRPAAGPPRATPTPSAISMHTRWALPARTQSNCWRSWRPRGTRCCLTEWLADRGVTGGHRCRMTGIAAPPLGRPHNGPHLRLARGGGGAAVRRSSSAAHGDVGGGGAQQAGRAAAAVLVCGVSPNLPHVKHQPLFGLGRRVCRGGRLSSRGLMCPRWWGASGLRRDVTDHLPAHVAQVVPRPAQVLRAGTRRRSGGSCGSNRPPRQPRSELHTG